MQKIWIVVFLCLPLMLLSASPLDSPHEEPLWLEISFNLLFDPLHSGFNPVGLGMDINFIFKNNLGIGLGASFAEWLSMSINGLYFLPIADLDNILFPAKLKIHANYLYKEWIYGLTLAAGIRPALFLSEDEEQRRVFLEGEFLVSSVLFFNRFDKQSYLFMSEMHLGILGDLSLEGEENYDEPYK